MNKDTDIWSEKEFSEAADRTRIYSELSYPESKEKLEEEHNNNNIWATYQLGISYLNGWFGFPVNEKLGVEYLNIAKEQIYDFYTDLEIFYWNKDMYEECICEQIEKVEKNIDKPYLAKNMVNFCFEEVTEKDNTQNIFNTLFPILLQKGLEGRYGALMILSHIFSEEWYTGRMFSSNKKLGDMFRKKAEDISKKEQHV